MEMEWAILIEYWGTEIYSLEDSTGMHVFLLIYSTLIDTIMIPIICLLIQVLFLNMNDTCIPRMQLMYYS